MAILPVSLCRRGVRNLLLCFPFGKWLLLPARRFSAMRGFFVATLRTDLPFALAICRKMIYTIKA